MAKPISLILESSSGGTFSFDEHRGMPSLVIYESLENSKLNAWVREHAKTWVKSNPELMTRVRLQIVVDLAGAPAPMRGMVKATASGMVAPFGIKEILFDWDQSARLAFGLPPKTRDPIYALLDANNCVAWGRHGKLEQQHWEEMLTKLNALLA